MREILYPWTGLPIKPVLVGTHFVACLEIEEQLYLSYTTETETTLVPLWITPGFPPRIRLPSTTNTIPVQNQGNYRAFNLIQSSSITLAHSDERYTQNYGKFMETSILRTGT